MKHRLIDRAWIEASARMTVDSLSITGEAARRDNEALVSALRVAGIDAQLDRWSDLSGPSDHLSSVALVTWRKADHS